MDEKLDNFKNFTALIVDDDRDTLDAMQELFELIFKEVFTTLDAISSLETIRQKKIDIAFIDINMPILSGFELIEKIREMDKDLPIVIISAYDDKEKLLKAIKLGIFDYVIKPVTYEKLKNCLYLCKKKLKEERNVLRIGKEYYWDRDNHQLYKQDEIIPLSISENKLFSLLVSKINIPVSQEVIFEVVFEDKEFNAKSIRNLIFTLRKKIYPLNVIKNIYGGRYMLTMEK